MAELIILKLGGSAITRKSEEKAEVNEEVLNRVAREIADAKKKRNFYLVIVHGAGPFGHVPAKEYELDSGLKDEKQIKGVSITHQSMEKLNFIVVGSLRRAGLNTIAFQPSAVGILKDRELIHFPTEALEGIIKLGVIPVTYGDVLVDENQGVGILSGDHLVPYLAKKLKASRVIIATDVAGIFDSDPKANKNARLIPEITSEGMGSLNIGNSTSTDVTGGMQRKVQELLNLAMEGIQSEVVSALEPGIVRRAILGERNLGTVIRK